MSGPRNVPGEEHFQSMDWKIFCIEEAGIGFGPQNVKTYENNMEKLMKII